MPITIRPFNVDATPAEFVESKDPRTMFEQRLAKGAKLEAFGLNAADGTKLTTERGNAVVNAYGLAYGQHLPITISPDDVWICIAQGFAKHIELNAEKLRPRFVEHEGQMVLVVKRNEFVRGKEDNDWPGVFGEFSTSIREYTGEPTYNLFTANFTTTGLIERAASEIILMDAMKAYFKYEVHTLSGYPEILVLGEVEDWEDILHRVQAMGEYDDIAWWTDHLEEALEQIIAAFKGGGEIMFWKSLYKSGGGSGGPYITGWINTLFPYLEDFRKTPFPNKYLNRNLEARMMQGNHPDRFPSGISSVPFDWQYYGETLTYQFISGFVGSAIDEETSMLRPVIGWGVVDKTEESK